MHTIIFTDLSEELSLQLLLNRLYREGVSKAKIMQYLSDAEFTALSDIWEEVMLDTHTKQLAIQKRSAVLGIYEAGSDPYYYI